MEPLKNYPPPQMLGAAFYRDGLKNEQRKAFYDTLLRHYAAGGGAKCPLGKIRPPADKDCFAAYEALKKDRPELYRLGCHIQFMEHGNRTGTAIAELLYRPDQVERIEPRLDRLLAELLQGAERLSEWETEKTIYERIALRLQYHDSGRESDHNAVGPLLFGTAVCEGWNALLLLALRRAGIPCIKVNGTAVGEQDHCWAIAWIGGSPVHLDVTWDIAQQGVCGFWYFNLTDAEIAKDHSDFAGCPVRCQNGELGYYRRSGCRFDSQAQFARYLRQCLPHSPVLRAKLDYADSENELFAAAEKAIGGKIPARLVACENQQSLLILRR